MDFFTINDYCKFGLNRLKKKLLKKYKIQLSIILSLAICTHNRATILEITLPFLKRFGGDDVEILLIDNALHRPNESSLLKEWMIPKRSVYLRTKYRT